MAPRSVGTSSPSKSHKPIFLAKMAFVEPAYIHMVHFESSFFDPVLRVWLDTVRRRVFCNRKPGLRLESVW
jgi:hypothetical protein